MSSWFSRITDRMVESQFAKDASGRLVFVPFTRKGKCYFIDSKADEEKIRAFVKMYRVPTVLISFLITPIVMIPGLALEDFGGLTPRAHRLAMAMGISGFFWLCIVAVFVMLWVVYKTSVPGLTASLSEVGPDIKAQLSTISPEQRRVRRIALVCGFAGLLLVGLALVVLTGHHFPR